MTSRRDFLQRFGSGFGLLGLASLLEGQGLLSSGALAAGDLSLNPLAPRPAHFAAKAKRVIWLFMNGGPSQVDTWDYKPELEKRDGQSLEGFDPKTGFFPAAVGGLMKSPFQFGLVVPGIDLRRPAVHEQPDDRLRLAREVRRPRRQRVIRPFAIVLLRGEQPDAVEQASQGERTKAATRALEEAATR